MKNNAEKSLDVCTRAGIWKFSGFFDAQNAPEDFDYLSNPISEEYRIMPNRWMNDVLVFHSDTFYMGQDSCTYSWAFEEISVVISDDIQLNRNNWSFVQVDANTLHAFNGTDESISVYEKAN
ncbi:hypothetical protein LJC07_02185 [Christensenellaceae bacterium OttesenSCG-928-L17]|nr:hypothetical protein [Christensenellaceae bacterium OttesenSCG-928-L17]